MEVRSARPSANRAVAALQSASGPAASASPLITTQPTWRIAVPIVRYKSFEALRQARQLPDENAQLRAELQRKLSQPAGQQHDAATPESVSGAKILGLLTPPPPPGAEAMSTTSNEEADSTVRERLLRVSSVEAVVVVPALARPAIVATEAAQLALTTFFVSRGVGVRSLTLRRADEAMAEEYQRDAAAAAASSTELLQPLRLPAPWMLQLVSHMPYLTELDLRHVQWTESRVSQVLPYLLSDLHIANVGTLRSLKVDAEVMQYWAPGWWRRHVNLRSITVGSRYSFAPAAAGAGTSAPSPPPLLEMPSDYYAMMREEGRHWRLKLWCPLRPASMQQLLCPAAGVSFVGVEELLVSMRHNERVCEGADHSVDGRSGAGVGVAAGVGGDGSAGAGSGGAAAAAAEAPADAKAHPKGRKVQAVAALPEVVVVYPKLHTVTIADVSERPEGAAEVYTTMVTLAPELRRFTVCDTVQIGAAVAEGGRGERAKRAGGGAGKNVN